MPLSSYNRVTSIISCKPSERQQHRLCHTDVGQSIIYKCLLPEHIYTFSLCWVKVNRGASCSLAGSLSQSNCLTLASRRGPLVLCSVSVCCNALHFISLHCISLQCIAVRVQFHTLWCSRGALVGSGYGTPYGGQDMAGGEKQCSRSRRSSRSMRSSSRSRRKDER